jgi:hypothetical protein
MMWWKGLRSVNLHSIRCILFTLNHGIPGATCEHITVVIGCSPVPIRAWSISTCACLQEHALEDILTEYQRSLLNAASTPPVPGGTQHMSVATEAELKAALQQGVAHVKITQHMILKDNFTIPLLKPTTKSITVRTQPRSDWPQQQAY